jgi:hypothetical protein
VRPGGVRAVAAVAGIVGALTLRGGTFGAAAAPAAAVATAITTADAVSLGVSSIQPLVLTSTGTLTLSGTLVNNGTVTLTNLSIQLRLSNVPVGSRSELAALAASTVRPPGDLVQGALLRPTQPVLPGGRLAWTLAAKADTLALPTPGVYPVAIEVIADDPTTGARTRYGTARTFLPWDLSHAKPTRLAVLWPVLGTPSRDPAGKAIGTAINDQLAGRLTALLAAAGGSHLTWLLDGDTLESVRQLADTTATSPTPTPSATGSSSSGAPTGTASDTTGTAASTAHAWLETLGRDIATGEVVSVPFGDPDLVATVRSGRSADIGTASTLGAQVVGQALGGTVSVASDVAWPADSTADSRTLTALSGLGAAAVILSDQYAAPARPVDTYTPSGIGPIAGTTLTGIVSDSILGSLFSTPTKQQGGPAMARQRFLSELAMVTAELPSAQRSLVVVPPRRWTPEAGYVKGLLDVLDQVPWIQPSTLAELRAQAATGPARARPSYPKALRGRELSAAQYNGIRSGYEALEALTAVVADPTSLRDSYVRALLRSESTVWRTGTSPGLTYVREVDDSISAQVASVRVVASGALTLAARSGKIPVTVENGLNQPVTIRLAVEADPAVRLTLTQPASQRIPAGESRTFEIPAEATTNGNVQLIVWLRTPAGRPYGSPVTFPVQITGFGEVAQLVVGAAFILLAVALVVRVARAIRRGRRPGSEASVRERAR